MSLYRVVLSAKGAPIGPIALRRVVAEALASIALGAEGKGPIGYDSNYNPRNR